MFLFIEAFKLEADGSDTIGAGGVHDAVFHPASEVPAPIENGEVFVKIIPSPSAEAFWHLKFFEEEFFTVLEALAFRGSFTFGCDVVFTENIFGMKSFSDSDFHFYHCFSPLASPVSVAEIFNHLATG